MNAITSFDKKSANLLGDEAIALLKILESKYGVKIRPAGGTFAEDKFTMKVEIRLVGEGAEKAAFDANCALFHCKPEDYGRIGIINGQKIKLVGFELKRSKFPIRGLGLDTNKVMLYTEDALWKNWKVEGAMRFHAIETGTPEQRQQAQDAEMKAVGFTHRVNGWVHPEAGGSDYPVEQYFKAKPTDKEVASLFARSCVKDDFKITVL